MGGMKETEIRMGDKRKGEGLELNQPYVYLPVATGRREGKREKGERRKEGGKERGREEGEGKGRGKGRAGRKLLFTSCNCSFRTTGSQCCTRDWLAPGCST